MASRGRDPDDELDDVDHVDEESDEAYCPECGAVIWDQADVCPKCFSYIAGDTSRHPPRKARRTSTLHRIVVVLILLGMFAGLGLAILTKRW